MAFYPESIIGKRQDQLTAINCTSYLQQRSVASHLYTYRTVLVLLQSGAFQRFCFNIVYPRLVSVTESCLSLEKALGETLE